MKRDVIIPLDFPDAKTALGFLDKLEAGAAAGIKPFVKVGMELFYAAGPGIVRLLKERGHKVFLDLKLHDIPNTVKSAVSVLSGLGADIINLHAAGGSMMMRSAVSALRDSQSDALIIGVTVLTSIDEDMLKNELLIARTPWETVTAYAKNCQSCGLDGVVCSPAEAPAVKEACGAGFVTVTPGIRFPESAGDDQSRITTPSEAKRLGSDFIVVGRPITRASNPAEAYLRCVKEFIQ